MYSICDNINTKIIQIKKTKATFNKLEDKKYYRYRLFIILLDV